MARKSTSTKKSAKRKSVSKKTAVEKKIGTSSGATIRKFEFSQSGLIGPGVPNTLIQGDRLLNNANRRLYRQHKVYRMKVSVTNPNVSTLPSIKVFALQNTWWTRKAMKLAKHIYDEAVSEERAVVGSSRWHDFRIDAKLPLTGDSLPVMANLLTGDFNTITEGTIADGEYEMSHITTTDNTGAQVTRGFIANGGISTAFDYDIFSEYNDMGPDTMNDPVFVAHGAYNRATGTSFEAGNVEDLLNDGNMPPYNAGDLPFASPWVQVGEIRGNAMFWNGGAQIGSTGYFEAPLGLVYLQDYQTITLTDGVNPIELHDLLTVEFDSGDYKGVEAVDI